MKIDEENTEFLTREANYQSLIIACEEGIRLLSKMIHG